MNVSNPSNPSGNAQIHTKFDIPAWRQQQYIKHLVCLRERIRALYFFLLHHWRLEASIIRRFEAPSLPPYTLGRSQTKEARAPAMDNLNSGAQAAR